MKRPVYRATPYHYAKLLCGKDHMQVHFLYWTDENEPVEYEATQESPPQKTLVEKHGPRALRRVLKKKAWKALREFRRTEGLDKKLAGLGKHQFMTKPSALLTKNQKRKRRKLLKRVFG